MAPVVPTLPAGAVGAVWFGYNGNTLTLAGADQMRRAVPVSANVTPSCQGGGVPGGVAHL